jgi:hypothetical protein
MGIPMFHNAKKWRIRSIWLCNGFESVIKLSNEMEARLCITTESLNDCRLTMSIVKNNHETIDYKSTTDLLQVPTLFKQLKRHFVNRQKTKSVWIFFGVCCDEMENYIKKREQEWCKMYQMMQRVLIHTDMDVDQLIQSHPLLLLLK